LNLKCTVGFTLRKMINEENAIENTKTLLQCCGDAHFFNHLGCPLPRLPIRHKLKLKRQRHENVANIRLRVLELAYKLYVREHIFSD
jgi:hypothetical protein